jgi:hypothetical protein
MISSKENGQYEGSDDSNSTIVPIETNPEDLETPKYWRESFEYAEPEQEDDDLGGHGNGGGHERDSQAFLGGMTTTSHDDLSEKGLWMQVN